MFAIIVTGHGAFARGILQSAEMIFGKTQKVVAVTLAADEGVEDLVNHYRATIQEMQPVSEILFLVDLWGGAPFNAAQQVVAQAPEKYGLIAGVNLPMLTEALAVQKQPLATAIPHLEQAAQGGIRHLNLDTAPNDDRL